MVLVEVALKPFDSLVHSCPLLQIFRVRGRVGFVCKVADDCAALGEAKTIVIQCRDKTVWIDRLVLGVPVLARHQVNDLIIELDALLCGKHHDNSACRRGRIAIELHGHVSGSGGR